MTDLKLILQRNPKILEFLKFGIVGFVALIILYAVYCMLLLWLEHNIAYTIGYVISFISNYILTVKFTFHTNYLHYFVAIDTLYTWKPKIIKLPMISVKNTFSFNIKNPKMKIKTVQR